MDDYKADAPWLNDSAQAVAGFESEQSLIAPIDHSRDTCMEDRIEGKTTSAIGSDVSDEELEREGRFYGPDSSWRSYTHDIRALSNSLARVENNDLSIHLYNAHMLKVRLRVPDSDVEFVTSRNKRSWIPHSPNADSVFYPRDVWTAWPLLPDDVPRSREVWGAPTEHPDEHLRTYRKVESWKPSKFLVDELNAVTLRLAKRQLRHQNWIDCPSTPPSPECHMPSKDGNSMASPDFASPSDSDSDNSSSTDQSPTQADEQMSEEDTAQAHPKPHTTICVDEDRSAMLLKLSTGHLIAKMNDLLVGLHKSRRGHRSLRELRAYPQSRSQSRSRSISNVKDPACSPSKRKRHEVESEVEWHADHVVSDNDDSKATAPDSAHAKLRKLGLRDWSEVLSIAAFVGWDPMAIHRAAQRCATLFKEGMAITTMPEVSESSMDDSIAQYVPKMISPLSYIPDNVATSKFKFEPDANHHDVTQEETPALPSDGNTNVASRRAPLLHERHGSILTDSEGYTCPEIECSRYTAPYNTRWRLLEHLRRAHGYSKEAARAFVPRKVSKHIKRP